MKFPGLAKKCAILRDQMELHAQKLRESMEPLEELEWTPKIGRKLAPLEEGISKLEEAISSIEEIEMLLESDD